MTSELDLNGLSAHRRTGTHIHTHIHTHVAPAVVSLTVSRGVVHCRPFGRHFVVLPRSLSHRPDPETRIMHTNVQRHRFLECVCVCVCIGSFFSLSIGRRRTRRGRCARARPESFADGMWVNVSPPPFHPAVHTHSLCDGRSPPPVLLDCAPSCNCYKAPQKVNSVSHLSVCRFITARGTNVLNPFRIIQNLHHRRRHSLMMMMVQYWMDESVVPPTDPAVFGY